VSITHTTRMALHTHTHTRITSNTWITSPLGVKVGSCCCCFCCEISLLRQGQGWGLVRLLLDGAWVAAPGAWVGAPGAWVRTLPEQCNEQHLTSCNGDIAVACAATPVRVSGKTSKLSSRCLLCQQD